MDTDTDFDGFFAVCHFCLPHKSSHTTKTIDDCFQKQGRRTRGGQGGQICFPGIGAKPSSSKGIELLLFPPEFSDLPTALWNNIGYVC